MHGFAGKATSRNFVFRSSSEPSTILMISLATGVICARAPTVVVRATVGTCQGRTVLKRHAVLRRQCCVDASSHRRLSGAFQVLACALWTMIKQAQGMCMRAGADQGWAAGTALRAKKKHVVVLPNSLLAWVIIIIMYARLCKTVGSEEDARWKLSIGAWDEIPFLAAAQRVAEHALFSGNQATSRQRRLCSIVVRES